MCTNRSWELAKEGLKHTRGNQMCAKKSWEHIMEYLKHIKGKSIMCKDKSLTHQG